MRNRSGFIVGFFLVSFSLLFLEMLITRIFSYVLLMNISYLVISIAFLGIGAGGVYDALKPVSEADIYRKLKLACFGASSSLIVVFFVVCLLGFRASIWGGVALLLYYPLVFIPFFFMGLVLARVFRTRVEKIGFIYGINMAASGLGALVALWLLRPIGAEAELLLAALLISIAGVCFCPTEDKAATVTIILASLFCLFWSLKPDPLLSFRAAGMKPIESYRHKWPDFKMEYSRWDPLGKVDVFSSSRNLLVFGDETREAKGMTIDGTANTPLIPWGKALNTTSFFRGSIYGQGYLAGARPNKVLIVGLGGGIDVQAARHFGAREITGVEVNRSVIDAVRGPFSDYLGGLYEQPGVEIVHADGRHYMARSKEKYDLIQFSGVDTASDLQWGLNLHSESYLYTREAFADYFRHLNPDGVISMWWFEFHPPRVMLRAAAVAAAALEDLGAGHPERHFLISQQSCFVNMVVCRRPFTEKEITRYIERLKASELKGEMLFDFWNIQQKQSAPVYLRYAPGREMDNAFSDLMVAFREGRRDEFIRDYVYDISVTSDDRPFFWNYYTFDARAKGVSLGLLVMVLQLLQAVVLSLVFILYPIRRLRKRDNIVIDRSGMVAVYFVLLGLGYMFVEICLMQRFAFYLGNPAYSMATILGGLLISSGAGAYFLQGRIRSARRVIVIAVIIIALILVCCHLFLVPRFVYLTMGMSLAGRTMITLVLVMPLGFFMGMPFPAGLRIVGAGHEQAVPWAFGINAAASVAGPILCVFLAMEVNFSAVLICAAGLYLAAGFLIRTFPSRG